MNQTNLSATESQGTNANEGSGQGQLLETPVSQEGLDLKTPESLEPNLTCFGWSASENTFRSPFTSYPLETSGLLILFLLFGLWGKRRLERELAPSFSQARFDLLRWPILRKLVSARSFSFWLRLPAALLLVLVITTGFLGQRHLNFAASFTWLFWWTALIFFVAFAGKVFCAVCPWDFFANLIQFGGRFKSEQKPQSFNLKWPKVLKNIYPAIGLFILLTWLELGFDITRNGLMTAVLGLSMVILATLCAMLFERRTFCRYVCPVGRISGLYAQFSPVELRTSDPDVCRSCKGRECVVGTQYTSACPTAEIPFKMNQNTYCTMCTECVRSCPSQNLTLKLRPFGTDLSNIKTHRPDEALLALIMLTLTYFHGLTMTATWFGGTGYLSRQFAFTYSQSFSLLMALILLGAVLFFKSFDHITRLGEDRKAVLLILAYAFIPLALGYHLGHNAMHLFGEGLFLLPSINDPFGYGWNLFGLANFQPYPLFGRETMRWLQLVPLLAGFGFSTAMLVTRITQLTTDKQQRKNVYATYYGLLLSLAVLALWLIAQPMAMKSGF